MRKDKVPSVAGYAKLLGQIKARIQQAQIRAILSVNAELVRLYWNIGQMIDQRQQKEGWGAGVIPRLAGELHNELPELKGFSERNIKLMVQFSREYPNGFSATPAIGQPPVAQLRPSEKGQSLVAQIPWTHNVLLMQRVKDRTDRHWYMQQALANGWSRNVLLAMIESQAHRRQGRAVSNFDQLLPAPESDLAQQTLKDPYIFDFLTLQEPFHERELETELIRHLEKFLLELGQGFAFVGRQYRIEVSGKDYSIDLLFYQLKLRAFVVIDLKTGPFKPEYTGKINFYCNVINDQLRHPHDQPTIGLILCQSKDQVVAEYALAGIDKPIGISSYELTRALPASLKSALPTVEQLEAELGELTAQSSSKMLANQPKKQDVAKVRVPSKKRLAKNRSPKKGGRT